MVDQIQDRILIVGWQQFGDLRTERVEVVVNFHFLRFLLLSIFIRGVFPLAPSLYCTDFAFTRFKFNI
jgi:hypothetical protein